MKQNWNKTLKQFVIGYITISLLIAVWELTVFLTKASSIVIVKPSEIYPVIFDDSNIFLKELWFTMYEAITGWILGGLAGFAAATLIYNYKNLARVTVTLAVLINAVPLVALTAIISGFWGTDQFSKILIVSIVCFFPVLITSLTTYRDVSKEHIKLFSTYAASKFQTYFKLIFPYSLPSILLVLKVNTLLAISTAIISEFFGAHGGIGQFILSRKGFYDLPMVWGAIFYIILAGVLFYGCLSMVQSIFIKHR